MHNLRTGEKELRKVLAETLGEMMTADRDVVYLEADLAGALGTSSLFAEHPQQAFNVGIMEANMIGVGSGMSLKGKIPFVHSFGSFASRRCADQVFLSGCYNRANIKILGSDPGVTAEANGGTHMPFEDIGIYRSFSGMTILDVAEPYLLRRVLGIMKETDGVMYLRFPRKNKTRYYEGTEQVTLGKGITVREGKDATVIASGIEVAEALLAAEMLASEKIDVRVIDMFTVKPLDEELVVACAEETGAVVTAENHNRLGGLGSAVAEVLAERAPVPFVRVGIPDSFGEVGDLHFLSRKFGIAEKNIMEAIRTVVGRK